MPAAKKRKLAPSSKIAGSRKRTKTRAKHQDDAAPPLPAKTFPFFELPAELRNDIYKRVAGEGAVILSHRKNPSGLISNSSLCKVNHQMREEYLSTLAAVAPQIQTHVVNFRFGHVITFLNRLEENELVKMKQETGQASAERTVKIIFKESKRSAPDDEQLQRWLNRVGHPTKKGADINFMYENRSNFEWKVGRFSHVRGFGFSQVEEFGYRTPAGGFKVGSARMQSALVRRTVTGWRLDEQSKRQIEERDKIVAALKKP